MVANGHVCASIAARGRLTLGCCFSACRRVPIIKMESYLGVEVDCSIGGMNGADTSLYAFKMSQKYQRFVVVVRSTFEVCLDPGL